MKGFSADSKGAYEKAGAIATDAVGGVRTVASFAREDKILQMFSERLEEPMRLGIRKAHVSGLGFGASQFVMFACNCLAFWYILGDGSILFNKLITGMAQNWWMI